MIRVSVLVAVLLFPAGDVLASAPPRLAELLTRQAERVAADPANPGAHNDLGNLLLQDGETEGAEAAYRRALEIDPSFVSAVYNLGLLDLERGALRDAEDRFRKVLTLDPLHAMAHYRLGDLDVERDRNNRAVRHYAEAFRLDPSLAVPATHPEVLFNRLVPWAQMRVYLNPAPGLVPRQYDDPAPLAQLIVGELRAAGEAAPEGTTEPTEEKAPAREEDGEDGA